MTLQEQKARLRARVLKIRDTIPTATRIEKGLQAADLAADHVVFDPGTVISGFFPIRSEIDIRPLLDRLRVRGARLALPVVIDKATIVFRELDRTAELVETGFGTFGPGPDAEVLNPQILLIPLSVFDWNGGRIGYGAGYYDRAIEQLIKKGMSPTLIGCAFECQGAAEVPTEPHDQPLQALITEKGYFSLPATDRWQS